MGGVVECEIRTLALTLPGGSRKIITCWAMGLSQHRNAVATIREVVNVCLLLGAGGRPGAGLCPVSGHSNVMGIFEKMPEPSLAALDRECELIRHISPKLNRSPLVTGRTALIPPCLGRSGRDGAGKFVTCENSTGVVQMSRGVLAPASPHLPSEAEIIARLADALAGGRS